MKIKKIIPCGYRVLVEIPDAEKKTKSGIILVDDTTATEQRNSVIGTIKAKGKDCDDDIGGEGDLVLIAKYGGFMLKSTGLVEADLRILNDEDILAKVEIEESEDA